MNQYEIEIQQLKTQVCELQEQLKKYTAPTRSKKYIGIIYNVCSLY